MAVWIYFVLLAEFIWAICSLIDKFVIKALSLVDFFIAFLSSATVMAGIALYYKAVQYEGSFDKNFGNCANNTRHCFC